MRQVICVHTNLIRLKTVKKKFILISHETTLQFLFVQKCVLFLNVILKPFFKIINAYMLLNFSNLHAVVLILNTNEYVSSLLTNVFVTAFNFFFRSR